MTGPNEHKQGYGNIYTPHAGSMIIQVQREGGLANRTIILSPTRVRMLRFVLSRTGMIIGGALAVVFVFFGIQAARVPFLTRRLATMEIDAKRIDTLQQTLGQLQKRYEQVQTMLGASPAQQRLPETIAAPVGATTTPLVTPVKSAPAQSAPAQSSSPPPSTGAPTPQPATTPAAAADTVTMSLPSRYPLDAKGYVTRGVGSGQEYGATHPGLDIAVPEGTPVRAAGGGLVVEVSENAEYGKMVRLAHPQGYETRYGHLSQIRVRQGDRISLGTVLGLSGNTGRSTAPHLHFEMRKGNEAVDPMTLIQQPRQ
jgi:murein DD-endopeptidase MepM/ murein hydrolase activator NlpD